MKLKKVITEIEQLLEREKVIVTDELFFLYGALGNLYRIYGQSQTTINYLELGLELSGNYSKEIVALIRLGEALKYHQKPLEALPNLTRL